MTEVPGYAIVLGISAPEGTDSDELDATAEAVLRALHKNAAFVAMGPVVSVDYGETTIEVDCSVCGETPEEVHGKIARIMDVMLDAANSFQYQSSSAERLDLVPA